MIKTRIKYPYSLEARETFAGENRYITVRYGTSRGRDTYGYTTCTLTVDGKGRRASCCGGGYSLTGACLGEWLQRDFTEQLQALDLGRLKKSGIDTYGLGFWDKSTGKNVARWKEGAVLHVQGACGEDAMHRIIRTLGYNLIQVGRAWNICHYYLEARREKYISQGY
jgi:hypothetical protein